MILFVYYLVKVDRDSKVDSFIIDYEVEHNEGIMSRIKVTAPNLRRRYRKRQVDFKKIDEDIRNLVIGYAKKYKDIRYTNNTTLEIEYK